MQESVRRATAFALVASVALLAPVIGALVAVPFALIAVAGRVVSSGPIFDLFARPTDRQAGELKGLIGFTLAATALALLTALADLPGIVLVSTLLVLGYGNLLEEVVREYDSAPLSRVLGFVAGGTAATIGGLVVVSALDGATAHLPTSVFLGLSGAIAGAIVREISFGRDDQLTLAAIAVTLWVLVGLELSVDPVGLVVASGVAGSVGYVSWRLETASITGMLTGVLLSLATIVLGGYGWFAVLIAFFGIGGMASKYRYEEKRDLGVAEDNEGARGSRNVLGNAGVALAAVVGFAAVGTGSPEATVFQFVFLGSLSAAMSDTLSSEIGVLFGPPRLVTTLERVETGIDGGITLKGTLVGIGGGGIVAGIAVAAFGIPPLGAAVIVLAGVLGMLTDSVLGATAEGRWIGNQAVNFLATLSGGTIAAAGAIALALA